MTIAKIVSKKRKEVRHSLRKVSSAVGISPAYLQDIERGFVKRPKMNALVGLANYFNLPADDFILLGGRLPADVFYKIQRHPELISVIRKF